MYITSLDTAVHSRYMGPIKLYFNAELSYFSHGFCLKYKDR